MNEKENKMESNQSSLEEAPSTKVAHIDKRQKLTRTASDADALHHANTATALNDRHCESFPSQAEPSNAQRDALAPPPSDDAKLARSGVAAQRHMQALHESVHADCEALLRSGFADIVTSLRRFVHEGQSDLRAFNANLAKLQNAVQAIDATTTEV